MKNLIGIIAFFCASLTSLQAQEQNSSLITTPKRKEIGVSNLSLSGASLLYKKEVKPDVYRRWNFGFTDIGFSKGEKSQSISSRLSFSIGKEKRKNIVEKLSFIHGAQYGLSLSFNTDSNNANTNISYYNTSLYINPNFGYLFGAIYQINKRFYIGVESVPSLYTSLSYSKDTSNKTKVKLNGINLNASGYLNFTAMYRFKGGE
jgi:hypothetical protein